ncbi:MAG: rod shape-determining protein MreC [Enterococcus sp.]
MKKFNPNKNIIITLIIVIIVVTIISITAANRAEGKKNNFLQSLLNDSVALVDRVVSTPAQFVSESFESIQDLFVTYSENEQLKAKLDTYDEVALKNENYEREISDLKEELALNETLTSYEKVTANVITRSPDSWQDTLVVDKGSKDGVEANMAVMANNGLVGRVLEVNNNTSKIELLTSSNENSDHFPVRVLDESGDSFGIMNRYDEKNNQLIVEQMVSDNDIKEGDVVQTSGLGGNSPADLPIGEVVKVKMDSNGLNSQVYVKAYADMYDLSVVTIIQRDVEGG